MESEDPKRKDLRFYGRFMGLAFQMFLTLLLAALAGRWLDNYFQTAQPLITVTLILIALVGTMYLLIKDLSAK